MDPDFPVQLSEDCTGLGCIGLTLDMTLVVPKD